MKNILIIGYFGHVSNQLDGQTVKTRAVGELFTTMDDVDLRCFDTQTLKYNIFRAFVLIKYVFLSDYIIQVPARNGLKVIFPLVFVISKLRGVSFSIVNVGGWLTPFLEKEHMIRNMLKHVNAIFIETKLLKKEISENFGFNNLVYLPNFRRIDFKPEIENNARSLKLVFMSRIMRMKGVDILFRMLDYYQSLGETRVSLDFYGPVSNGEKDYFYHELNKREGVKYQGVIQPENIYTTLSNYDVLVLPTKLFTEGFPGAILDAYISGLAVIVSDWKHSDEFVDHGKCGFIFPLNDEEKFLGYVNTLIRDKEKLLEMKEAAYIKSLEYSTGRVLEIFRSTMF